jgi:WS/DGAT/MGAT family acyltransferase
MEAIMWRVGQDATLRMTVGALLVVDKSPTAAVLADRLTVAVAKAPRLRQRPDDATAVRARPAWVDEDDPVAEAHLRSLAIAAPGSSRQLLDLVGLLEVIPFDPLLSPWDVTLIEGLEGGRAAVYVRAHHALTDGMAGLRLLGLLLDEPPRPPSATAATSPAPAPATTDARRERRGDRPLGTFTVTIDVPRTVRRFLDGVHAVREIASVESAVRAVQRALDLANSVSRQMMVMGGPLGTRPAARSLLSRFETFSIERARTTALALGGSRSDLLVAATAAGLGRYYEKLGAPTGELRLATPTRNGHADELGGNWFAPARLEVPTAVGRPGPQFGIVAERLSQARREPALQVASTVAATIGRLPSQALLSALHAQADSVDFAATALPGLRGERHLCGSRIEAVYPLGPRLGCPMNITALGNGDRLDVGVALDPSAFAEPDTLVACLTEAFAGYVGAALDGAPVR